MRLEPASRMTPIGVPTGGGLESVTDAVPGLCALTLAAASGVGIVAAVTVTAPDASQQAPDAKITRIDPVADAPEHVRVSGAVVLMVDADVIVPGMSTDVSVPSPKTGEEAVQRTVTCVVGGVVGPKR